MDIEEFELTSNNNNISIKGKKDYDNEDRKPVKSFIKYISTRKRVLKKSVKSRSKKNGKKMYKKSKSKRRIKKSQRRISKRKH